MKYRSKIKKIQKALGTDNEQITTYELLDNGKYLTANDEEITKDQLEKIKGLKLIIEWVEPKNMAYDKQ